MCGRGGDGDAELFGDDDGVGVAVVEGGGGGGGGDWTCKVGGREGGVC